MSANKLWLNAVLLTTSLTLACAQIDLQCPSQPLTILNGTIAFTPLSEGSGPVDASYNASLVSRTWFSLANGFVDIVRNGGLPYDLILPVINTSFIQSSPALSDGFDPLSFLQNFAMWWAGILAVTLVGVLLGLCCCFCGCCYLCCRCCGKCGAGRYQAHRKNNDCLMFTYAIILLFITLILLAAAVLSFFSNEQTFQTLSNLQVTINSVTDNTVNYLTDTFREVFELFCQLVSDGGVASTIISEAEGVSEELANTVGDIRAQLQQNGVGNQLNITSLQEIRNLADNITSFGNILINTTEVLGSSLQSISSNLGTLAQACIASLSADTILLCQSVVNPLITTVDTAISGIPDVSDVRMLITDVESAVGSIDGQNADQLVNIFSPEVQSQLNSAIQQIRTISNGTLGLGLIRQIGSLANEILNNDFLADQCPPLDGFQAFTRVGLPNFNLNTSFNNGTSSPTVSSGFFELSLGYVRQCIINASFDYIRMFDTYRYAFGIVVCSMTLVTIGLIWIGLVCGFVGFNKGRLPSERSSLSNCGGIFLLIGIGTAFLFGFFLLLLSAIFFFFGANSLKICQAVQGPDYDLFAQTIDRPEVRDTIEALTGASGNATFSIRDIPSISGFFRQCEDEDTALFTALNLGALLPLPSGSIGGAIRSVLNITQLQASIDSSIADAVLNIDPANLSNVIQDGLGQLDAINITNVNITGVATEIESAIVRADLNNSIEELRNLSSQIAALGEDDVIDKINELIVEFEIVRNNVVPVLLNSVNELESFVEELGNIKGALGATIAPLANQIAEELVDISQPFLEDFINGTVRGTLSRSLSYLDQYIDHLESQIIANVGGCQPVYGVYTQIHNVICRDFVDGLNGFWWSLGFCAVLYIPLIIFATLAASFFRERETRGRQDRDNNYDNAYPMKAF